jgi:hypothetical protein
VPLTAEQIAELAANPLKVTGDSGSYEERTADDLIKLDQYTGAKEAALSGKPAMTIRKIVPPGSV